MRIRQFLTLAAFLFVGCQLPFGAESSERVRPHDDELAWIAKDYVGGRQCDSSDRYSPPDTERVLEESGVRVYQTAVEHYGVCGACIVCPAYAAKHYALIEQEQLGYAQQLGFQKSQAPPAL